MNTSSLGALIRTLRLKQNLTQAMLAEKLHITDKAVSKWERDLSCPDISLFPKLAELLGVTVNDLLHTFPFNGETSELIQTFDLSQDIRTPLHIILGCSDLAQNHADEREQLNRYLNSIRVSAEYLLKILDRTPDTDPEDAPVGGTLDAYLKTHIPEDAQDKQKVSSGYDFTGKRILVADDMAVNREIAAEMLRYTGAEVDCAEDGMVCVSMIGRAPAGTYDLILMDLIMPNMNGFEAARIIRKLPDPGKSAIPIIALTANVHGSDRKAAFDVGMNAFAVKPIDIGELLSAIRRCLNLTT